MPCPVTGTCKMNVSTEVIFTEYLRGSSAKADWRRVDQGRATRLQCFRTFEAPRKQILPPDCSDLQGANAESIATWLALEMGFHDVENAPLSKAAAGLS